MTRTNIVILFILLGLCVFLGDENQSIVLVFCGGGILGLYIHDWLTYKTKFVLEKTLAISWLVFFLFMVISSLHSLSLGYAISNIVKYICAFLLYVFFRNKSTAKDITQFMETFFYWTICMLVISCIFSLFPYLQQQIPPMNLIYKSFGHNHIVDILFFIIPYASYLLFKKKTVPHFVALLFLLFGVITSSSRGAVILLCVGIFYYLWNFPSDIKQRLRTVLVVFTLILCFIVIGVSSSMTRKNIAQSNQATTHYKSTLLESRISYWTQALESIKTKPWFGQGPGTFYLISKKFQHAPNVYSWFAHSYFLQSLAELGVLGTFVLSFLVYISFRATKVNLRANGLHSDQRTAIYIGLIATLLYSFIETNLDFTIVWMLFWTVLGLIHKNNTVPESEYVSVHLPIGFFLLCVGLYYISALVGMSLIATNRLSQAVLFLPYNASVIDTYVTNKDVKNIPSDSLKSYIYAFHAYNPDILFLLASTEKDKGTYEIYMKNAINSDPQNRPLLEAYITRVLKEEDEEGLQFVIRTMISTISVEKNRDNKFLIDHWRSIHDCFNSNTLIWNDSPFIDTYQAKSLYFAALCLAKRKDMRNAKELLRIASNSRPGWSNIYVDYAAIVWWNDIDYASAMRIIGLCKENTYAKPHCSEFDTGDFLSTSVYDASIDLEK